MQLATITKNITTRFYRDVMKGLQSSPKRLDSKYFYDEAGDELFQQIMHCDEYYLTNCEMEILKSQSSDIASTIFASEQNYDVIELGAGDCSKSVYLLRQIFKRDKNFTFFPVDISNHVIDLIKEDLPKKVRGLNIHGLNGEYMEMLKKANQLSLKKKLVLFMGSNIGNMSYQQSVAFCKEARSHLNKGDCLLIGFDLKKDPQIILNAYNDKQGITREFNFNLLKRINNKLNADFVIENFKHFPVYNPESGECKSYLVSKCKQQVCIGDTEIIDFGENETIDMEISSKYSINQTNEMAALTGFNVIEHFYDSKNWFVDVLWKCV
ncbi:MAG TPA: L-histidine N(alpha)-methyltransferase [Parafilimonas sp.]|jgi:dimethylhistidine N-methyltransferase